MTKNLPYQLTEALFSLGRLDEDRPSSLPPYCYIQQDFLDHELQEIFSKEWLCIGRENDVPKPGDFFTLEILGEPLLVVRSNDKRIRVLSNTCRHRSMQVAEGRGNRKLFVCPYHAWSYTNDGALKVAPLMEMKKEELARCALPELRSEVWMGFLFVNLQSTDPTSPPAPLSKRLKTLEPYIENYHGESFTRIHGATEIWDCNWKSLVENFMEGYHLSTVHPVSLGNSTPTKLCQKLPGGPYHTAYKAHYPEIAEKRAFWHPDTTPEERNCSTLYSIFPGLVVSQSPEVIAWLAITPNGIDQVKVSWGIATYKANLNDSEKNAYIEKWRIINEEDKTRLVQVRQGLKSGFATQGPLAPADYEGTILDFYRYLSNQLKISQT